MKKGIFAPNRPLLVEAEVGLDIFFQFFLEIFPCSLSCSTLLISFRYWFENHMIKLEFCQCTHHAGSFAVSQSMGIFLLLWPQARCELNIEFNIFLA